MFDILSEWAGHKVRQPGRRWSACSTGASIRTPHRVTVGMGRHGAESDSLTNRHRGNAGDRSCRTRSCTRIRHSVFSTVPACRRRWCRRPHAWISRRWPSPTTMVSTGSCVSRKPPRNWDCPPCLGRNYLLGAGQYRGFGTSAGIGSWPGGVSEVVAADGRRASVGWNAQRPEGQATL